MVGIGIVTKLSGARMSATSIGAIRVSASLRKLVMVAVLAVAVLTIPLLPASMVTPWLFVKQSASTEPPSSTR